MTVATETAFALRSWTGVETSFAAGFAAETTASVNVISRDPTTGVDTVLTQSVHYSVTLAGDGAVTVFPIALPLAPKTLVIYRDTPGTQATNFADLVSFSAAVHQTLHDRWARLAGELKTAIARVVRAPIGDPL
jgi:hypothetical protein